MRDLTSNSALAEHGWPAPAKLNLFLHITAQRADGYHELQSVFQLLDFGDVLQIEPSRGAVEITGDLAGVSMRDNLVYHAAECLRQQTGVTQGARINVVKNIPIGGGLGGGSSNAATALVALNQLWGCGLNRSELATLGLSLGADVPVFVHGRNAWAEGVGEQLQEIKLKEYWFVVIVPPVQVSTGQLFSHPQLTRNCAACTIAGFSAGEVVGNVFQPLASTLWPVIGVALQALNQYRQSDAQPARLTGTGACVFLPCDSRERAQFVLDSLSNQWHGFVACGVNDSPLNQKLIQALGMAKNS